MALLENIVAMVLGNIVIVVGGGMTILDTLFSDYEVL